MKKILFTIVLAAFLFNCETPEKSQYYKNEIIFVVDMNSNEGKSEDDIAEFSKYYTDAIDINEPNSLGWGFYNSGDKVILIDNETISWSGTPKQMLKSKNLKVQKFIKSTNPQLFS